MVNIPTLIFFFYFKKFPFEIVLNFVLFTVHELIKIFINFVTFELLIMFQKYMWIKKIQKYFYSWYF